jgi:IclR family transcriptional regulator, KDG regulon repressor
MNPRSENLSSTEKALKILLSFTPHNTELGTLELSKLLGIHKSTVSRMLHLLTDYGFLQQNSDTRKYKLGRAAAEIGNAVVKSLSNSIVNISLPYLNKLCQIVGESVALEMLSNTDVILACHVEGQHHIRFSFKLGEQVPTNVAAGAKSILAFSDPNVVTQCLKRKFLKFNSNTIVSKSKYRQVLDEVRKAGVSYDKGERYEDTLAVATPVFNHEGKAIAAVVIAGPTFRMTPAVIEEIIIPLKKTAAEISQCLYF